MFKVLLDLIWKLPVIIYDFFLSKFLTIPAHQVMAQTMDHTSGIFLDVGCGTGAPLNQILPKLKLTYNNIIGVDLHEAYSKQAQTLFQSENKVKIYNMDYYKLEELNIKYGFIFFSFSFMLMPDPLKAIEIAKNALENKQEGIIAFLMTLNKSANPMFKKVKPLIRLITTVDFGNVVLQSDFNKYIEQGGLEVIKRIRIQKGFNIPLRLAPVYYIQTKIKRQ